MRQPLSQGVGDWGGAERRFRYSRKKPLSIGPDSISQSPHASKRQKNLWAFNFNAESDACSCAEMGALFTS